MSENDTAVTQPPPEVKPENPFAVKPKKRMGRPPRRNLEAPKAEAETVVEAEPKPIKKARVISESQARDVWKVTGKEPDKHYVWGRKDDDIEMSIFASKGYVPARGNEQIFGNPFETAAQNKPGETKERGGRILMCCSKEAKEARVRERLARRVDAKQAAKNDARKLAVKGATIVPLGSEETKRESLGE